MGAEEGEGGRREGRQTALREAQGKGTTGIAVRWWPRKNHNASTCRLKHRGRGRGGCSLGSDATRLPDNVPVAAVVEEKAVLQGAPGRLALADDLLGGGGEHANRGSAQRKMEISRPSTHIRRLCQLSGALQNHQRAERLCPSCGRALSTMSALMTLGFAAALGSAFSAFFPALSLFDGRSFSFSSSSSSSSSPLLNSTCGVEHNSDAAASRRSVSLRVGSGEVRSSADNSAGVLLCGARLLRSGLQD